MSREFWPRNVRAARALQERLRHRVRIIPFRKEPRFVAGVDAAFREGFVIAIGSLFTFPELEAVEDACCSKLIVFPYVPGLLTFREGQAITQALRRLSIRPDVVLVDGQGIAHPKGIGIASHLGVILDIPTIGCAKSKLVGEYAEPGREKGSFSPLYYDQAKVGAVLRTRNDVRPIFVSPGHLTDTESAVALVMKCVGAYRLPEPLRRADHLSKIVNGSLSRKKC